MVQSIKIHQIKKVLKKYFKEDDHGRKNKDYDESYSAQDAIDDIHEIIGEI